MLSSPIGPPRTLSGRHALITGAAGGIGGAVAQTFAEAGAGVILLDRADADMGSTLSRLPADASVAVVTADLADEADVARAMRDAQEHATVDIVVNGAGILTPVRLIEMDVETWDRTIAVNLRSVFLVCRHLVPAMVEARWGRVINISSQMGQRGGEERTHYSASKAGVIGFTKALAREVARYNVLVNAIAPGPIDTALTENFTEDQRRSRSAALPLGRFGLPEEVAPTALLLASEPAGNLYVGQTLGPNSGDVML